MKNQHFGHIVEQKYIDYINKNWQGFNDKASDLFFPYEDKNILKFPTVKELIPLLNENDTINFCTYGLTNPDFTHPSRIFKNDIIVKEFTGELAKPIENGVVCTLKTTIGEDTVTLRHIIELFEIHATIREIRLCD